MNILLRLMLIGPILILLTSCGPSDEEIAKDAKHKRTMSLYDCRSYGFKRCGLPNKPTYGFNICFESTISICMREKGYRGLTMREKDPQLNY